MEGFQNARYADLEVSMVCARGARSSGRVLCYTLLYANGGCRERHLPWDGAGRHRIAGKPGSLSGVCMSSVCRVDRVEYIL